ncbi:MAG: hypothetical protein RBR35_19705 [Salinivirgaceae bacterium]|nr:hypothetical protein [Salinivirgaceae bacterium]
MSDRRAIVNAEKAIYALADKEKLVGFLLVEENGKPKRLLDIYPKDMIINLLVALGGADVSGDDILRMGFGIGFPIETPHGSRWFFVETKPNFCPFCQGAKTVRNEADYEIISETCWVCNGEGRVETLPVPCRKGEDVLSLVSK